MKFNEIELYNFGSYEGHMTFDMRGTDEKNIILIGGKNGAGKTTLFNAIRLCLYGYMSLGYKSMNANYTRMIKRNINNNAKLSKPAESYVKLSLLISNGQSYDTFDLLRKWSLDSNVSEDFTVEKNGVELNDEERGDFEKYLLSIIPPELFNLYFFDGEKIADFFLSDGSNARIRNAFSTLCGYDTFEIMSKNFRRIATGTSKDSMLDKYLTAKEAYMASNELMGAIRNRIDLCNDEIANCESSLKVLDEDYVKKGGITNEEWQKKLDALKSEEHKREDLNAWVKKQANDILPFLLIKDQIQQLDDQLRSETNAKKLKGFDDILSDESVVQSIKSTGLGSANSLIETIRDAAHAVYETDTKDILNLSYDQNFRVASEVYNVLNFDESSIVSARNDIKKSIKKSAKIRAELEKSNVSSVNDYLSAKADIMQEKDSLQKELISSFEELKNVEEDVRIKELEYRKLQKAFEEEIKKSSINDISAKAILMLDKLQSDLYESQIKKVEKLFVSKMQSLMRKDTFIDDVEIDKDFNIILYKNKYYSADEIQELLKIHKMDDLRELLGDRAVDILEIKIGRKTDGYELPIIIDKNGLSAGEKQIFIMSLYFSLVELCKNEVPFVIDTPFARIDKVHRNNIAKEFFCKLRGQVFILSTDEEITESHMDIMKNKIAVTYLLENSDNKRTVVTGNKYF